MNTVIIAQQTFKDFEGNVLGGSVIAAQDEREEKEERDKTLKERAEEGEALTFEEAQEVLKKDLSINNFQKVQEQMNAAGFGGTPYIHTLTFKGWIKKGYCVKKGERAQIKVDVFIESKKGKKDEENKEKDEKKKGFLFKKTVRLFHASQVKKLEKK